MNRTTLLLVSAAVLCAIALAAGRSSTAPTLAPGPVVPAAVAPPAVQRVGGLGSGANVLSLNAALSSTRVLAGESVVYAKIDLQGNPEARAGSRVPVNLAVAIDRSGSMSGGKMGQARQAADALIDQLREGDRLAIIAFDTYISVYPSTAVTAATKVNMHAFVAQIEESASTNISGALEASFAQLRPYAAEYKVSRTVLLSDGVPTAGNTDTPSLTRLAATAREQKMSTSSFGIGLDYNAALMRDLASYGGGGYAFVEDAANLGPQFARELGDASQLLARDVRVKLEVPQGVVVEDVPGHSFTRLGGGSIEVPLYDFGPGQSAQLLVRLKVNAPVEGTISLGTASTTFIDVQRDHVASVTQPLTAVVTTDAATVTAASNPAVTQMAKTVDLTARVQQAQQAYERGDTSLAFNIMGSTRKLFGSSVDALAGDENVIEANWRRGGADAQRANHGLTLKTMKNFGQNNAY